jgi:hypothetical protein
MMLNCEIARLRGAILNHCHGVPSGRKRTEVDIIAARLFSKLDGSVVERASIGSVLRFV